MKGYGGFEHNLQSLRVVDELEEKYAEFPGLNLSFESREGILKHCSNKDAKNSVTWVYVFSTSTSPAWKPRPVTRPMKLPITTTISTTACDTA